jgi:S1-C subfamily serine protease
MTWIQVAAGALAAVCLSSYATAEPLEAQLGKPLPKAGGRPSGRTPPAFGAPSKIPAARLRGVLDGLEPDASTTRGAAESQIYARAAPSVVLILTEDAVGSGALISADGQIVTNLHVVAGAKQIAVVFKPAMEGANLGKTDLRRARVLKVDEVADLALIQVEEVPTGVQPLPLGDSSRLQVGADVHAIGHPTGKTWTYTRGIVSQVRRAYDWKSEDKIQHEATVIQTQTPINPGNSGGPLLDSGGALVGINSFTSEGEGLNFAVSVEDVKSLLARGHDRAATPAVSKPCEWQELGVEDWKDPVGTAHLIDTDCDGELDATLFVPKNRREPEVLMRDESGGGEYDAIYFDSNRDGHPDWALFDTDHNGKSDMRGDYRKGEDEPYRWEKVAE